MASELQKQKEEAISHTEDSDIDIAVVVECSIDYLSWFL